MKDLRIVLIKRYENILKSKKSTKIQKVFAKDTLKILYKK